ncbi:MAG: hypothetical protein WKF58_10830 [Ilumatobacteraceae bacterium]
MSTDEVCFTGDEVTAQLDGALDELENPEPAEDFIAAVQARSPTSRCPASS